MKFLIINCHWDNRGDEAAIRAMIDELQIKYPSAEIYVQRAEGEFGAFPENEHVKVLPPFPIGGRKRKIPELISIWTKGKINLTHGARTFYRALKGSDIVLHAPGGPSIGDIYLSHEIIKLKRLSLVKKSGIPYAFYAPSMGPFKNEQRNPLRKEILEGAALIVLREAISAQMVKTFIPPSNPIVTLDSAFQHDIDLIRNKNILDEYEELKSFISYENVIGITVTDLQWNALYKGKNEIVHNIRETFEKMIDRVASDGYRVLFIPQLFGKANDFDYMKSFAKNDRIFVMSNQYDCYFQQYIIAQLKAVIGMRYHSNIFSAKMGTPFISVSYEQKMKGFMAKANLLQYCIDISDLSYDKLYNCFTELINSYNSYKSYLMKEKHIWKEEAQKTTDLICDFVDKNSKRGC